MLSKPVCVPRAGSPSPSPLPWRGVGSKDRPGTYLLGQTARKQAGPGEEKGRQKNGVPPRAAATEMGWVKEEMRKG